MVRGCSEAKRERPAAGFRNGSRERPPQMKKSRESERRKGKRALTKEAASVVRSRAASAHAGGVVP
jgi:hypothetical protein